MQQLGGYATPVNRETAKLIEASIGKLTYDHSDSRDVQKVRFAAPIVFSAVAVHCRKELLEHMTTVYQNMPESHQKGSNFENQIVVVTVDAMGDFAPLKDLLNLPKGLEHLAERRFRLVSVHTESGEYVVSAVSPNSGASPQLAFKARRATDYLDELKVPKGAAFIRPDNNDGPDIHCLLQSEENPSWYIELVIQAKFTEDPKGLTNTVLKEAIESLDPDHFHMRFDHKVCTHPIVTVPNLAPANLICVFRLACIFQKKKKWVWSTKAGPEIRKERAKVQKALKSDAKRGGLPEMICVLAIGSITQPKLSKKLEKELAEHDPPYAFLKLDRFPKLFGACWLASLQESIAEPPMARLS